jgi:hypothetical protein
LYGAAAYLASSALLAGAACAEGENYGPVSPGNAAELGTKIGQLVQNVGMPIGGAILFLSVVVVGIKIMMSHVNPHGRAEAMSSLFYVGVGGVILGAAMFLAGFFIGMGGQLK